MHRIFVFAAVGDCIGQVCIRELLGVVGNEAGNLGCRFSGEVGPLAGRALRFVNPVTVIASPPKIGQDKERGRSS